MGVDSIEMGVERLTPGVSGRGISGPFFVHNDCHGPLLHTVFTERERERDRRMRAGCEPVNDILGDAITLIHSTGVCGEWRGNEKDTKSISTMALF